MRWESPKTRQTAVKSLLAALNQNVKLEVRIDAAGARDQEEDAFPNWVVYERVGTQGGYRIMPALRAGDGDQGDG